MSFNGSGVFVINSSGQPVVSATTITAAAHNALTADLASGLSSCITKDGQTTVTANLPMSTYKFTGLGNGSARTDSANLANLQDGTGIYVGTVGGTADVITLTPAPAIASYTAGQTFRFLASGANTTNVTVNVSGLGAKALTKNGTTALTADDIASGSMVTITYDGTRFLLSAPGLATIPVGGISAATAASTYIAKSIADAKGDILTASANNTPAILTVGSNGKVLVADSTQTTGLNWASPASAVSYMHSILNATLTVSMAANAVTIALKTAAGTDPSASDPVSVTFRHGTATNGTYVVRTVTGALSTVISSGSTGGTLNNTASRIYVGLLDNAGTLELCWWNPVNTTGLFAFSETELISTTAEGGAGGADSAQVVYSTTARSNVYARYLGYFESTQTTAGTWASAAAKIQLLGPGVPRTGTVLQRKRSADSAVATGTTQIPADDTIPQSGEGDQYLSLAVTPLNAVNLLDISAQVHLASTVAGNFTMALFQDATANALAASQIYHASGNVEVALRLAYLMSAGTTSATTLKIRAGTAGAGTTTFNGASGARLLGGVMASAIDIQEICA